VSVGWVDGWMGGWLGGWWLVGCVYVHPLYVFDIGIILPVTDPYPAVPDPSCL